jgi:hypothetical protein
LLVAALLCAFAPAQQPLQLDSTGRIDLDGRSTPYRIRRLPVSSFPQLPASLQQALELRGCLIPQTYQAHHPENVIHAALERPGSDDWALLCSVDGQVSLLVAFASDPANLITLSTAQEIRRLQLHPATGLLGFNWGIDPATPAQVRQAQAGLLHRPPLLDHDALADSILDRRTVYRFYTGTAWTRLEVPE